VEPVCSLTFNLIFALSSFKKWTSLESLINFSPKSLFFSHCLFSSSIDQSFKLISLRDWNNSISLSSDLKFISNEHSILKDQLDKNVKSDDKLIELFQSLKEINLKLWSIEDEKRQCEKDKDFGEKFIKLSRDVHFLNDDRAKIKLKVNEHTGSTIKEIKEYTSY
jgi:hypothetical protein